LLPSSEITEKTLYGGIIMTDCIFCKIINKEIPCSKVFENDKFMAFLDIKPAHKGHTLIIPKKHCKTFLDLPEDDAQEMIKISQDLAKAVLNAAGAEGFNVLMNNNKAAGQEIDHVHLHIIPRREGDNLSFGWDGEKYAEGEMEEYLSKIKQSL